MSNICREWSWGCHQYGGRTTEHHTGLSIPSQSSPLVSTFCSIFTWIASPRWCTAVGWRVFIRSDSCCEIEESGPCSDSPRKTTGIGRLLEGVYCFPFHICFLALRVARKEFAYNFATTKWRPRNMRFEGMVIQQTNVAMVAAHVIEPFWIVQNVRVSMIRIVSVKDGRFLRRK